MPLSVKCCNWANNECRLVYYFRHPHIDALARRMIRPVTRATDANVSNWFVTGPSQAHQSTSVLCCVPIKPIWKYIFFGIGVGCCCCSDSNYNVAYIQRRANKARAKFTFVGPLNPDEATAEANDNKSCVCVPIAGLVPYNWSACMGCVRV